MSGMGTFTNNLEELVHRVLHAEDGPTADDIETAMCWAGRNHTPALLCDLAGELGPNEVADFAGGAWSAAEYPEDYLTPDIWLVLFEAAGYRVNNVPAERPQSIRLYRGAPADRARRMAWTSSLEVAERFAHGGLRGRDEGTVWTVELDGEHLLAHLTDREEDEYIVHPVAAAMCELEDALEVSR